MEYRATVTTTCEEHKSHTVTLLGYGEEVWGAADAVIRVLEDNKADPVVHFYEGNKEINWRGKLNDINLAFALEDMPKGKFPKVHIAGLPF